MTAINTDQQRIQQLENAQRFNLDTVNIIRSTMKITLQKTQLAMEELYAEQGQPVLAVALNDPLTPLDESQIRAIEWVSITGSNEFPLKMSGELLRPQEALFPHKKSHIPDVEGQPHSTLDPVWLAQG